ncbi:DapH/DapD/GlmU-related protein [Alteribacillus sp. JSM 102045]|uniref:N-acetyltransferase n=1 Tax=Alteribacillus sp. JSM 102045 TaxID=1562101 RepID=UPI0035BF038C
MDSTTHIPDSTIIGKFVVIEDGVQLGENVSIGHHSVILKNTKIGDNVKIGSHCVLGIKPGGNKNMRKYKNRDKNLVIDENAQIGTHVSVYASTNIAKDVFIADHASIRENVMVGEGSIIGRGSMVEVNTKIGSNCTIQTLGYITAETVLENDVFIGPCVSMSNDKYMGTQNESLKGPYIQQGAKIGNNTSMLPGVIIGNSSVVGAGSVVTHDVPSKKTVVGVPARIMKKKESNDDTSS